MVDKLVLLSPHIRPRFETLATKDGEKRDGYAAVIDLRKAKYKIPARLYCRGYYNGIHKLEFIDVAGLGLPQVLRIARTIFGSINDVKICRIDLCLDFDGISVEFFSANCLIPKIQNYKIFRTRGAVSYYLQVSGGRTTVIYNKLAELRAKQSPRADDFHARDTLTRVEIQLKGNGVPFKRLRNIHKYARANLLQNLQWSRLRTDLKPTKATHFLAQMGLRALIKADGLQRVSKMFQPSAWAWIKATFLVPMENTKRPKLDVLLRKSVQDWLDGKIRFPRAAGNEQEWEELRNWLATKTKGRT